MPRPLIRRNDYGTLGLPGERWRPTLSVSIVVPAHGKQERLDVVLAALAAQTYPAELMEVVVVDDGSEPPLRLPELRPERTRIVAPATGGWASAHATNSGVERAENDVVLRLDSDMLVFADHVASQMRWHHAADYLAVLGHKRFVDYRPGDLDPTLVFSEVREGRAAKLFDSEASEPQWIESIIERENGLRDADHRAFRVLVGASFSVHRDLYLRAGGMDADVLLGSDTIFGYRLHQAGAVFVPDNASSSWHLGPRQISTRGDLAKRYRKPFIANRVPELDRKRPRARRSWDTPLADVFVDVGEHTESCVDAVLEGLPEARVTLLGKWPEAAAERQPPLDDLDMEARVLAEAYRAESRVRTAETAEADAQVPYRLHVPASARLQPETVPNLLAHLNQQRLGQLEVALPDGAVVRLERTAALARAAHVGATVAEVWGAEQRGDGEISEPISHDQPMNTAPPRPTTGWRQAASNLRRRLTGKP
jgi:GT2 family glycosyltransferase